MDKRYYSSLGVLALLVLVAWAMGPANFQLDQRDSAAVDVSEPGEQQETQSKEQDRNFVDSGILVNNKKPTARIPQTLFNGSWKGGRASQSVQGDSTATAQSSIASRNSGEEEKNADLAKRPSPIFLGSRESARDSGFKAKIDFPLLKSKSAQGEKIAKLDATNSNARSLASQIPGRGDGQAKTHSALSFSNNNSLAARRSTFSQNHSNQNPSPPTSSSTLGADFDLDFNKLAGKLQPIQSRGSSGLDTFSSPQPASSFNNGNSSNTTNNALASSSQKPYSENSDPLFRPIITDLSTERVAAGSSANSQFKKAVGSARGIPFSVAGHTQIRSNSQPIRIPGASGTSPKSSKPNLAVNRVPTYQQEYIWHVLSSNETLESIASAYDFNPAVIPRILKMNKDIISNPKLLPVGKAIRIPVK